MWVTRDALAPHRRMVDAVFCRVPDTDPVRPRPSRRVTGSMSRAPLSVPLAVQIRRQLTIDSRSADGVHRLKREVVGTYLHPRQYYAMLRNKAMTSLDRLQLGLFFCLCTRPRKFGTGARSDAVCRSHRSQALFRGEWLRLSDHLYS